MASVFSNTQLSPDTQTHTHTRSLLDPASVTRSSPVFGALEPVEDVAAAGVINLIERVGVGLLHCHRITGTTGRETQGMNVRICVCVSGF